MRFLLTSLTLLVFFSSCSLKTTEGLRATAITQQQIVNPYFSNTAEDYVYKAKIDIYGRYFGGILILKKINATSHRVVFTTEFGSKIFDFLFEGDTFTKNYILEELDKNLIVNTLKNDFQLLIRDRVTVEVQYASESYTVFKTVADNRYDFYFFDASEERLKKIVHTSKTKEKLEIRFTSEENNKAEHIAIDHQNIKLTIDLNYLKND